MLENTAHEKHTEVSCRKCTNLSSILLAISSIFSIDFALSTFDGYP